MNKLVKYFLLFSLVALVGGMLFGALASLQFLYPEVLPALAFFKTRPLHVSCVVGWIFLASSACVYRFVAGASERPLFSTMLTRMHLVFFVCGGLIIAFSFAWGSFGGREYWEFNPYLSVLVILTWLFFLFNFFRAIRQLPRPWPVYYWMWCTGVAFFLLTFLEANLWIFPFFGHHIVRDLTVQWKAYGALVGSWNMLVYGIAIYLAEQVSGNRTLAHGKLVFAMYFLGFFNLLFGWAHHIYVIPCEKYIRVISYAVSMTELIILFKIIRSARPTLQSGLAHKNRLVYSFLFSSDIWIFLNLALALAISVPAINMYTHGTHVTVAHAMGSTIGINTFILLGAVVHIVQKDSAGSNRLGRKTVFRGVALLNIALASFWVFLILAGVTRGIETIKGELAFRSIQDKLFPHLLGFALSGLGLLLAVLLIAIPLFKNLRTQINTLNNGS
jgi:nitric oxide reductase subunit B